VAGAVLAAGRRERWLESGRRASWKVVRSPRVGRAARWLSHEVAAAPTWSPLRPLTPLRSLLKGEVTARRLGEILEALARAEIPCWLAGGWGVDALAGRQTRRHDDVDIIVRDFPRQARQACEALRLLGFVLAERHTQEAWMPDQWTLEDGHKARVDLLSLDWERLRMADPALASSDEVFSLGRVAGRDVECLSLRTQRLLHSGFAPRSIDRHDGRLLA